MELSTVSCLCNYSAICVPGNVWICVLRVNWSYVCCFAGFWFLELLCTIFPIVSFLSIAGIFVSFLKKIKGLIMYIPFCCCSSFHFLISLPLLSFFVPVSLPHFHYLTWLFCHLLPLFPYCSCSFLISSFHYAVIVSTGWFILISSLFLDSLLIFLLMSPS